MLRYNCPGCGRPSHGKKCRFCGYESFGEIPVHRPEDPIHGTAQPPKDASLGPVPKSRRSRKGYSPKLVILVTMVCLLFVFSIFSAMMLYRNLQQHTLLSVSTVSGVDTLEQPPLPDPAAVYAPEEAVETGKPLVILELYADDSIRVTTDWQLEDGFTAALPLTISNNTAKPIRVQSRNLTVNGHPQPETVFLRENIAPGQSLSTCLTMDEYLLKEQQVAGSVTCEFQLVYYVEFHPETECSSGTISVLFPEATP